MSEQAIKPRCDKCEWWERKFGSAHDGLCRYHAATRCKVDRSRCRHFIPEGTSPPVDPMIEAIDALQNSVEALTEKIGEMIAENNRVVDTGKI